MSTATTSTAQRRRPSSPRWRPAWRDLTRWSWPWPLDSTATVSARRVQWWWGLGLSVAALQDETELAKLRQVAADGVARRQQVQDAAPTNATILEVFGTFDRDGNGTLDVKELPAALRELGLNLNGVSTKGILARYGGDASRSIDVGEFTQLVLELHEAVVLHGSSTGKASVIQSEREEMRTTDHLPTGKGTALGKARARAALEVGGEKSSPGRQIYRRRPAGTSDADPFSQTSTELQRRQAGPRPSRATRRRAGRALDPEHRTCSTSLVACMCFCSCLINLVVVCSEQRFTRWCSHLPSREQLQGGGRLLPRRHLVLRHVQLLRLPPRQAALQRMSHSRTEEPLRGGGGARVRPAQSSEEDDAFAEMDRLADMP